MDKFQGDASTTHILHNGAVDRGGHEQKDVSYSIWMKKCLRWIAAMSQVSLLINSGKNETEACVYIYIKLNIYIYIYIYK